MNKISTTLLALSMFFTGASSLVNEYVLSTVSTYILGSSIEQFSITIAMMLGMMGIGGWVQKFVNDDLISKFVLIEIALALLGSFAPILTYAAFGYFENNFNLIYYSFVIMIGFLVGFEIPFLIRINEEFSSTLKANVSTIMASDYIGSFLGAMLWVYYLLPHYKLTEISFFVSGVNFFIAILTFLYFTRIGLVKFNIKIFSGIIVSIVILVIGLMNVNKVEIHLEQKLYKDPILTNIITKYQNITLTQNKSLDEIRLYINGNVQFSSLDELRYHEMLVHPVMNGKHANVLILGGGDGLALKQLQQYKDIESITLVDLDPGMIEFAKTNEIMRKLNNNAFDNANIQILKPTFDAEEIKDLYKENVLLGTVNVLNVDADSFLNKFKKNFYDVVIVDFPDPSSIELTKLYSKEFFMKLKRVMKPETKFIIQSTSPYHAKESFLCIGRTLAAAGFNVKPTHLNIPSFGDWGWWVSDNVNVLDNSYTYLTPDVFKSSFIFGKGELHTEDTSINTLMGPTLLNTYIKNSWLNY